MSKPEKDLERRALLGDRQAGQNGAGIREDGKSYTLDTISRHGVAYKN